MKTAIKILIWIGMISQCFLIYPIVVGILALKKLDEIASGKELQTMGILTTIFCSLIGGILMICIKDEDLGVVSTNSDEKIVVKTKVIIEKHINESISPEQLFARTAIKAFIYTIVVLTFVCFMFALLVMYDASGIWYISLIINSVQILVVSSILIVFLFKEQTLSKTTNALMIINGIMALAQIPLSVITNYCWAYLWYPFYESRIYGVTWYYWVICGINIAILILVLISLLLSFKTKQSKITWVKTKDKKIVTTSNIEVELNELQRILDSGVIKQEEYDSIRASIISKYYSN